MMQGERHAANQIISRAPEARPWRIPGLLALSPTVQAVTSPVIDLKSADSQATTGGAFILFSILAAVNLARVIVDRKAEGSRRDVMTASRGLQWHLTIVGVWQSGSSFAGPGDRISFLIPASHNLLALRTSDPDIDFDSKLPATTLFLRCSPDPFHYTDGEGRLVDCRQQPLPAQTGAGTRVEHRTLMFDALLTGAVETPAKHRWAVQYQRQD
ncbi:hypothetical protein CABS01_06414 [Colletotrichum abscissum]|uniref:Uncharacterized protein n=1 Tax=Colletotrichum abscissum TaxID=1671311 RepID=A0A9P9X6M4_9PEZI|nr:uncharacterized protein CABS01_06414 [Colletotrichum abscissum]KAI3538882.1 hypothetical protein CABS02_11648 [Colletotrichum abscissum]KAK1516447.1 hypothetical protein CABS01_06414 [Colletotrichum abscissum]